MSEPVFHCKPATSNIFYSCFHDAISFVQVYMIQRVLYSQEEKTADAVPQWLDLLIILCEDHVQVRIIC